MRAIDATVASVASSGGVLSVRRRLDGVEVELGAWEVVGQNAAWRGCDYEVRVQLGGLGDAVTDRDGVTCQTSLYINAPMP